MLATILIIFRVLITAFGLMSLFFLANIFQTGRLVKRTANKFRGNDLETHQNEVLRLGVVTFFALVVVEFIGRPFHLLHHNSLWRVHLYACAIPFLILFITTLRLNGSRRRNIHRFFAYPCIVTGVATNVLGAILAWK